MSATAGRGTKLERCYRLAAVLARGGTLDRRSVASELDISLANADRHIRAIQETMSVSTSTGKDGLTVVTAARPNSKTLATPTVVAACFGASLARLFHGTPFEQRLKDVVSHVLVGVRDVPKFRNRERQFLFIPGGGERALRKNGASILEIIVDAILDLSFVRLGYTHFNGDKDIVRMKPLSLALHEHQLYVLGSVDGELKNVRFSRITAALKLRDSFEYPSYDEYDPRLVFADSLGIFIRDNREEGIRITDVAIRLAPRWKSYVETHRWHESQRHRVEDENVILTFHIRTCPELERLILGFGRDAEVLEPDDLRQRIASHADAMTGTYRQESGRPIVGR